MAPRRTDAPTSDDVVDALLYMVLERISGIRVGAVTAYDQAQRTATVQTVRRRKIWGKPTDQPPLLGVPVGWWRFGGMVLAGEVEAGDTVLLLTCEREVWPWYASGQAHDPQSERMHDATDTIALPWISALTRAITARQPGTLWIGREDASAGITITMGPLPGTTTVEGTGPGSIALGSDAVLGVARVTDPVAVASPALQTLKDALDGWVPAANDGGAALKTALAGFIALSEAEVVQGTGTITGASIKVLAE
jgi:hypothetical protein